MTKEQAKMLGYFDRLDAKDQDLILDILQKSLRINRIIWSTHCFELLERLEHAENQVDATIDMFHNNHHKD